MLKSTILRTSVCVAVIVGSLTAVSAGNWPMWRGPQNHGVSEDAAAPTVWTADQNIAWKTSIPGSGHSSPIVWDDAVFVTSADVAVGARQLLRIDRATGRIVWTQTVATAGIEKMHRNNSPASGTPATDGERVVVTFQTDGQLLVAAFDFDGGLLWKQTPGRFESRHGFNTSPVIWDQSVLISGLQDGSDAFMARLDLDTGQILWKTPIIDPIRSFSSPLVIDAEGRTQIALSGSNRTQAFDPQTGDVIWSVRGPAQKTVSSLLYSRGLLFVPGGRDRRLFAISPLGTGDVTESHIVWEGQKGIPYVPSPVIHRGILHVLSDKGVHTAYRPEDGQVLQQRRLTSAISSSLVAVGPHIYVTEESGRTTVVSADAPFDVVSVSQVSENVYASLAVSDGEVFIRGRQHLFCIRAP